MSGKNDKDDKVARRGSPFGVPTLVFLLILVGVVTSLIGLGVIVLAVLVPVVGYYVWDVRQKNRELEERIDALEGHPNKSKQ
jgi:hypothetical protein